MADSSSYPLPSQPAVEKLMPGLYDVANKEVPNESCYARQLRIQSMNQRGNPQQSPELAAAVQSQCCKQSPVMVTLQPFAGQVMNPVPGPKS